MGVYKRCEHRGRERDRCSHPWYGTYKLPGRRRARWRHGCRSREARVLLAENRRRVKLFFSLLDALPSGALDSDVASGTVFVDQFINPAQDPQIVNFGFDTRYANPPPILSLNIETTLVRVRPAASGATVIDGPVAPVDQVKFAAPLWQDAVS